MNPANTINSTHIIMGAAAGLLLGGLLTYGLGDQHSVYTPVMYVVNLLASVFIALLKMILVPLVFCAIAVGVAQLSGSANMQATWRTTIVFFASTSFIAVCIGLIGVNLVKPGVGIDPAALQGMALPEAAQNSMQLGDFVSTLLVNTFANPISAMANGNIVAVAVFAIFVGVAIIQQGKQLGQLHTLLEQALALFMHILHWIMRLAPIGIGALLCKLIAGATAALLLSLAKFIVLVISLTLLHGLVVLPFILWLLTKRSPIELFKKFRLPMITAFSTSSSSATLPVTLHTLENVFAVRPAVAKFVAPLGSQINMDGTAMYEAIAALFVAQLFGIDLTLGQQGIVVVMAMVAAVGAPGIPSAGMVTMVMVLQSVGLPVEAIGLLLPIDRLLDAFRTAVNVEGDIVGSLVVDHLIGPDTIKDEA